MGSEDPVGFYSLPNTQADTLYTVITDILTRCCSLLLCMCRGQAYDVQGKRSGLATKIRNDVPAALPVHCLASKMQAESCHLYEMHLTLSEKLSNWSSILNDFVFFRN